MIGGHTTADHMAELTRRISPSDPGTDTGPVTVTDTYIPSFRARSLSLTATDGAVYDSSSPAYYIAPNRIPGHSLTGLSTDPQLQSIVLSAPAIAGSVIGAAAASGAAWATAAIPVVGPIIAGVTLGLTALFGRKGPKQKLATTAIVNELEPKLRDNVTGYFNIRTASAKAQALANFDAAWQWLVQNCATEQYGDPGQHCVADRDRNACVWHRGPNDPWQQYDNVVPGECWNWWKGYRDPIANDTPIPDPALTGAQQGSIDSVLAQIDQTVTGGNPSNYLLIGGALLLAAAFAGGLGGRG